MLYRLQNLSKSNLKLRKGIAFYLELQKYEHGIVYNSLKINGLFTFAIHLFYAYYIKRSKENIKTVIIKKSYNKTQEC